MNFQLSEHKVLDMGHMYNVNHRHADAGNQLVECRSNALIQYEDTSTDDDEVLTSFGSVDKEETIISIEYIAETFEMIMSRLGRCTCYYDDNCEPSDEGEDLRGLSFIDDDVN